MTPQVRKKRSASLSPWTWKASFWCKKRKADGSWDWLLLTSTSSRTPQLLDSPHCSLVLGLWVHSKLWPWCSPLLFSCCWSHERTPIWPLLHFRSLSELSCVVSNVVRSSGTVAPLLLLSLACEPFCFWDPLWGGSMSPVMLSRKKFAHPSAPTSDFHKALWIQFAFF